MYQCSTLCQVLCWVIEVMTARPIIPAHQVSSAGWTVAVRLPVQGFRAYQRCCDREHMPRIRVGTSLSLKTLNSLPFLCVFFRSFPFLFDSFIFSVEGQTLCSLFYISSKKRCWPFGPLFWGGR